MSILFIMMRKMCEAFLLCAAEEEQLLDSVMDCGHGNWSDIGNRNQSGSFAADIFTVKNAAEYFFS
jgi:hypothetical protein